MRARRVNIWPVVFAWLGELTLTARRQECVRALIVHAMQTNIQLIKLLW